MKTQTRGQKVRKGLCIWTVGLILLVARASVAVLITEDDLPPLQTVKLQNNQLVFPKVTLPKAVFAAEGVEDDYHERLRSQERRLEESQFGRKTKKRVREALTTQPCFVHHADGKFFQKTLSHRIWKILEKQNFDTKGFRKELKTLGTLGKKWVRRHLKIDLSARELVLKNKPIRASLDRLGDLIVDGIRKRLQQGIVKSVSYSEDKLTKSIFKNFDLMCTRSSLIERARQLRQTDYFVDNVQGRLAESQLNETKPISEHLDHLKEEVNGWRGLGAIGQREAWQIKDCLGEMINRFNDSELKVKFSGGFNPGQALMDSADKMKTKESLGAVLDGIRGELGRTGMKFKDDKIFIDFVRTFGKKKFETFDSFYKQLNVFLKSYRDDEHSSADQTNRVIGSARKLYLKKFIDRKKFSYSQMKKGILEDLDRHKNLKLYWSFFENIVNKNVSRLKTNEERDGHSKETKIEEVKRLFESIQKDVREACALNLFPEKFGKTHFENLRKETFGDLKAKILRTKDLSKIKSLNVEKTLSEAGRLLKNVDTQSKSYSHVLLTSLLDAGKSLNSRYLKRCKKLFSKRRSMAMFTKEGFYLIIIKMFFEAHKSFKFEGIKSFETILMEYLETLEYFKYISVEQRMKIVYHVISLISEYIDQETHTFQLDKFYAFYKMIINPDEPIDYSGEKVYEDWPDKLLLNITHKYSEKIGTKQFRQIELMVKQFKDARVKVNKPQVQTFLLKHNLTNPHKLAKYLIGEITLMLRKFRDKEVVPTQYAKVLLKSLISMLLPVQSRFKTTIKNVLRNVKDHMVEVGAPPQVVFLMKQLIHMNELVMFGFKSQAKIKTFGVKVMDRLIIPELPMLVFVQKSDFMTRQSFQVYLGKKIESMVRVIRDMKIAPETQMKFLLAGIFRLSMSILTQKKVDISMEFKKLLDRLVIPETPYSKFVLKTLLGLGELTTTLSYAKATSSFYVRQFIDSLIKVEPKEIKFLVTSKLFSKAKMEAYRKSQFRLMANKVQDALIRIQNLGNFLVKSLLRSKANYIFGSKSEVKTFFKKVKDEFIHVEPAMVKFLVRALVQLAVKQIAVSKSLSLHVLLRKFQDYLIHVQDQTKFLVKSLLRSMGKNKVYTKAQLKLTLKKFQDRHIHVDPGIVKFLARSTLKIASSLFAMGRKFRFSTFNRKFVDSFIPVEPAMVKFLLRGQTMTKAEATGRIKRQIQTFFNKVRDKHVEISRNDKFLISALLQMCRQFEFGSVRKLRFFLKKFQDAFVQPQTWTSFLVHSILQIGKTAFYGRRKSVLNVFLKKMMDKFIQVEPGLVKFLLHSQAHFKHTASGKKLTQFRAFWLKAQDFLVSPLSWDKFFMSKILFSRKNIDVKKIAKLNLFSKKLTDYFIYVTPGMQKFLLTAYLGFMRRMSFHSMDKVRFFLKKFVDALNVPLDHQKFLLTALMGLSGDFLVKKQQVLRFQTKKFLDYFVSVDIPGKVLYSSVFTKNQVDTMQRLAKVKVFWKKYQDFFLSPMRWDKFLIYSALFTNLRLSQMQKTQFNTFMNKLRDFHVLVQPNMPKFLLQSLYMFLNEMKFYSRAKLNLVLKKFVDNLIFPRDVQKFLLLCFQQILSRFSVQKKTHLRVFYKKLWDFYIKVEPPGKFLVQSELQANMRVMRKSLADMRVFWMKMQDFLVSPMSPEIFLLTSLFLSKGVSAAQRKTQLRLMAKKVQDFYNLVEPNFVKFLLASMIKILSRFSFSSKYKLSFFLKKVVDQFILTDAEQKFLVTAFMQLLAPAFAAHKVLSFRLMYHKFLDKYIDIPGQNFLIKHESQIKKYETAVSKLVRLQTRYQKLQDFFISPLNMRQYLIMSVLMNSTSASSHKLLKLNVFRQKMQDFFILAQPGFIKFLLQALIKVGGEIRFHSQYKLNFFLKKFVDEFVQPEVPGKFLLRALIQILRPSFAVNQKIDFRTVFRKFLDYMVPVEIPGKFLINSELEMDLTALQHKVAHLSGFWQKFQDFLVTPEPLHKFLLKSLILTSTDDDAYKKDVLRIFAVRLQDYHILAEPGFVKFLLQSYLGLLARVAFSSKAKLAFFLKRFVDAFNVPEIPGKFLLKSLLEMSLEGFHAYKKVQVRGWLQKFADKYIPVQVPGKFLVQSESEFAISEERVKKVARMKAMLVKMQDFFVSPLPMDKFIIFSLLFNRNDPNMSQASQMRVFDQKMRDFHVLVDLPLRKFLVTSLVQVFADVRFASSSKLHFMLEKFLDSFNVPEVPGKFLLNSLMQLMSVDFRAYKKFTFSTEFKKMLDFFIEPDIPGKFLIMAQTDKHLQDIVHKVADFRVFLSKVQDFLVVPMSDDFMLYSLIAFKGVSPSSHTFRRFFAHLQAVQDFHILTEPGFVMFLLHALTQISQDIHFLKMSKVRFFLRKVVDQFIQVEGPQKFLVSFFAALIAPSFAAKKTLNLRVLFSKMSDQKIDPLVPDKFLVKSDLFHQMESMYAHKISRLKGFFLKLQDFFIEPISFEKFLLQSVLELKLDDLSFVKTISPRVYFKVFQDYHNIVEPNTVMFILHNLLSVSKDFVFSSKRQLRTFLGKYLDEYIQVVTGIKFLENALMSFFAENFQVTKTKLSIMCQKYIDSYIEVEPQMKFLLKLTMTVDMDVAQQKKLQLSFLLKKLKDEKIEVDRQDKFYLGSFLENRGMSVAQFKTQLRLFEEKMRDFFIQVKGQQFLIKSLLEGQRNFEASKQTQLRVFLHKLKDEYIEATPYMVIFLMKSLLSFFGDLEFKNKLQLNMFLKQYVDLYYDVLARNTMLVLTKMFQQGADLVDKRMNFNALFKRLKMGWLFRQIRGVNVSQKTNVYHQFLQFFNLESNAEMSRSKMGYLFRLIRGVNISNVVNSNHAWTEEMSRNFYKRLYNFRLKFVRRGFGFSVNNKRKMNVDLPTLMKSQQRANYFRQNIKQYFKLVVKEIGRKGTYAERARQGTQALSTLMGRTKIKMYGKQQNFSGIATEGPNAQETHMLRDVISKTLIKTLTHQATEDLENNKKDLGDIFKRKKETMDSLDKIYFKTLDVMQGTAVESDKKALDTISKQLRQMQDNLKKVMLKELRFEDKPAMPKQDSLLMKKGMVSQTLREMDNKLKGIGKVLLKLHIMGKKSKRLKFQMEELPQMLADIRNFETFQGFKAIQMMAVEPKRLAKHHRFEVITDQINKWLKTTKDVDPTQFMKVFLLSSSGSGNKVTDTDVQNFLMSADQFMKDVIKHKEMLFEPSSKALLLSVNTHGNKVSDKEYLLKKLVGSVYQKYIEKKRALTPHEFGKILLKNLGFKRKYHKILKKANLQKIEKNYDLIRKSVLNLPVPQAKIMLLSSLGPGNKISDVLPKEFQMKSLADAQNAFHTFKMTLETAKRIYLKGTCMCCCEYYIISNFEECEEYEDTGEDYVIDKALHQMEVEGDRYSDYEKFDEIVRQIENQDFRCESGPRNMFYNILPNVKITLGVKRFPGAIEVGEPQELTETGDIKNILGSAGEMYDIDVDFIDKMVEKNMAMDPKNVKAPRKNNYFDTPEYVNSARMIDFLDRVYNTQPDMTNNYGTLKDPLDDVGDLAGKDFHEEHELTRNERLKNYSLDAEKISSDVYFERLLKQRDDNVQKIQLDSVHLLDQKPIELEQMEETVDKL